MADVGHRRDPRFRAQAHVLVCDCSWQVHTYEFVYPAVTVMFTHIILTVRIISEETSYSCCGWLKGYPRSKGFSNSICAEQRAKNMDLRLWESRCPHGVERAVKGQISGSKHELAENC